MATQRSTRPADRSDSGPPGKGYRKALGLDDAELNAADQRRAAMKRAGCTHDLISILLPKMDDPPLQLALQTAPLEFGDE